DAVANQIGRITPAGAITEFDIPTISSWPTGITAGPDGNLWFNEFGVAKIGRISTDGIMAGVDIPTDLVPPRDVAVGPLPRITAGPDGNLWFTEFSAANKIGRITTSGTVMEFDILTINSAPTGIAPGPDGNIWFAEGNGFNIARITPN